MAELVGAPVERVQKVQSSKSLRFRFREPEAELVEAPVIRSKKFNAQSSKSSRFKSHYPVAELVEAPVIGFKKFKVQKSSRFRHFNFL